ncbi:hypothetical protein KL938_000525 [Ogataea parapolymorpha]|nr:hypothetical protein KL938_000525 [Ogataea parapolymorpha]
MAPNSVLFEVYKLKRLIRLSVIMSLVSTNIIINAAPETVRSIFLDFDNYEWSAFVKSIKTNPPKPSASIAPGDKLDVVLEGNKTLRINPVVVENSLSAFRWKGNVGYDTIFNGIHSYEFNPTEDGKTEFVHKEIFGGLLRGPLLYFVGDLKKDFRLFTEALKSKCEA